MKENNTLKENERKERKRKSEENDGGERIRDRWIEKAKERDT